MLRRYAYQVDWTSSTQRRKSYERPDLDASTAITPHCPQPPALRTSYPFHQRIRATNLPTLDSFHCIRTSHPWDS